MVAERVDIPEHLLDTLVIPGVEVFHYPEDRVSELANALCHVRGRQLTLLVPVGELEGKRRCGNCVRILRSRY